jgi:kumamolisin
MAQMLPLDSAPPPQVALARRIGPADATKRITVTVIVRRKVSATFSSLLAPHSQVSREQFSVEHGADDADLAALTTFARANNLEIVQVWSVQRRVVLRGTVADLSKAFSVKLDLFEYPGGRYMSHAEPTSVPKELRDIILAVVGLDNRPLLMPRFRLSEHATSSVGTFTPDQVGALYRFPVDADGSGQTVGILEFGGGYNDGDLDAYFAKLGVNRPQVASVGVSGAGNQPSGDPTGDDGEVVLDIEVLGAVAPGARQVVYFAPNSEQGFVDGFASVVHDQVNSPSVISTSWGAPEENFSSTTRAALDSLFQDAVLLGTTVLAASGDGGSSDGVGDGALHVDYPASSPWVTGCGGTTLLVQNGLIAGENTWNHDGGASGGGVSQFYAVPDYQAKAGVVPSGSGGRQGRGVPDVAGNADPTSGYQLLIDGQPTVIGGTSAVAPLWAGLVARINQLRGSNLGFLNPQLYALLTAAAAFRDIVNGNNDASGQGAPYQAAPGWDACTGLGVPDGTNLAVALGIDVSKPVPPTPAPSPSAPNGSGTMLVFRTPAGGVGIAAGTSQYIGDVDVHDFEQIRVIAIKTGADVTVRLTSVEDKDLSAVIEVLVLDSNSCVTRIYDLPGRVIRISAAAVPAAGPQSGATIDFWVYGRA